jgi:hypothetical protein
MIEDDHLYLDVKALASRGWTRSLVQRFLGAPDQWGPVAHWANFTGKRVYFLGRVEQAEASQDFQSAFRLSVARRLDQRQQDLYSAERVRTQGAVAAWQAQMAAETPAEREKRRLMERFVEALESARAAGLRTPHKTRPGGAAGRPRE